MAKRNILPRDRPCDRPRDRRAGLLSTKASDKLIPLDQVPPDTILCCRLETSLHGGQHLYLRAGVLLNGVRRLAEMREQNEDFAEDLGYDYPLACTVVSGSTVTHTQVLARSLLASQPKFIRQNGSTKLNVGSVS